MKFDFDFDKYKKYVIAAIAVCIFFTFGNMYMQAMRKPVVIQPAVSQQTEPDDQEETEPEFIQIYITGEVHSPGLYTLQNGDRIGNAVDAAGGMTDDADKTTLNLAAFLSDAQHVIIPKIGEELPAEMIETESVSTSSTKININTASQAELMTLPGVGEVVSNNIITYRENNGSFRYIEEIKNVTRIGDRMFESIRDLIVVK